MKSNRYSQEIIQHGLYHHESIDNENDLLSSDVKAPALEVLNLSKSELEEILRLKAIEICVLENIDFFSMHPVSRMSLIHYRCTSCGLLPLYCLDITSLNKTRCTSCGMLASLKNGGKHGRVRKKIAIAMYESLSNRNNGPRH